MKDLVIVGAGEFAEIACQYFAKDSEYQVVAFAVESQYLNGEKQLLGLPIVPFENLERVYPPERCDTFVAITYTQLNRTRKRLFRHCKGKGYHCASYISSHSFVWENAEIGENTFIFENNDIQYHARVGDGVVIWSGGYIAHRTVIENFCWLSGRCAVAGFCRIGEGSFLGTNITMGDNVVLGKDTVLGAGSVVVHSLIDEGCVYVGNPARKLGRTSYEQFYVDGD